MNVHLTDRDDGALALAQYALECDDPTSIPRSARLRWARRIEQIRERRNLEVELSRDVRGARDGYFPPGPE